MNKINISHLTSVHPRYDTRIFLKMCSSLAKDNDFSINLVVADSKGNEQKNGINIIDVGKAKGRVNRIFKTTKKVLQKAMELDSDIYHLHDPELIPIGLKLKKLGKKVIFDSHEDVPKQIMDRDYLDKRLLKLISLGLIQYEKYACSKFDAVVTATPSIRNKFLKINSNSLDVNNYPIIGELSKNIECSLKKDYIAYIGGIAKIRGIKETIKSLEYIKDIDLILVGEFVESYIYEEVKRYQGWNNVQEKGFLNRQDVATVLSESKAGLVTFHPLPNHIDAQPNKIFEYMSAGLPVIASNFPLWKEIIEGNECGICVDPMKPEGIAKAMDYIVNNPKEAEKMGKNGQKAVVEKYNWKNEEIKLLNLYKSLME
jgi:glycosyltransferase involved in cell wall biosynthesis